MTQLKTPDTDFSWNARYLVLAMFLVSLWLVVYLYAEDAATWITVSLLKLDLASKIGSALEFFLYDTAKIFLLVVALIYLIALLRAVLKVERVRTFLTGKRKSLGYALAAIFGGITPFCSCSSVPLFLGFTSAGIPFGVTMTFLITSPLINEIAIILLWGLLGWKFTIIYVVFGLMAGIIGGALMDALNAGRWLRPRFRDFREIMPRLILPNQKLPLRARHNFAWQETRSIFSRIWLWVLVGVAAGALMHGYIPEDWFAQHLGSGEWWTVPLAVLVGIPLYANVTGIVPIMESLLNKGLPAGTTLAFCMSSVAASLPEFLILRQIMTAKLQALFMAYLWIIFTLTGWLFNLVVPYLA